MSDLAAELLSILPSHKASLSIEHNGPRDVYETVADYAKRESDESGDGWVSVEEKERAIATNEMWELRWYPHTPIGFSTIAASTLEALLAWLREHPEAE